MVNSPLQYPMASSCIKGMIHKLPLCTLEKDGGSIFSVDMKGYTNLTKDTREGLPLPSKTPSGEPTRRIIRVRRVWILWGLIFFLNIMKRL